MKADISDLIERFPMTRIAFLVSDSLKISEARPEKLQARIMRTEAAVRDSFTRDDVGKIPGVRVWREAYKGFGVKKTSYRSSVERLLRKVLNDEPLPAINTLVDCYNRISIRHLMPVGADDLAMIDGDIGFRFARQTDSFIPLGQTDEDPPKPGEVVYADQSKVLCRRWNWYQDTRSPVSTSTTRAVLTIQSLGAGDLEMAASDLARDLETFCGATTAVAIADKDNPEVSFRL
ncbi:B3/4 domain-containing protein [Minwuia sp.]|uniref:B3/B4 domain-containing protein n=1 Tax=Minwuia sp. TaxID=2493630 RepID=UPI003A9125AA